jgi:hypothetical protein
MVILRCLSRLMTAVDTTATCQSLPDIRVKRVPYMACEALQMVCVSQRSHELTCQAFSTLPAYLPSPLWFRRLLV